MLSGIIPMHCLLLCAAVCRSVFETLQVCLTSDGLPVTLLTSFQYVPINRDLLNITLRFKGSEGFAEVVTTAASAAIVGVCSQFNISEFQGGRPVIQARIDEGIRVSKQAGGAPGSRHQAVLGWGGVHPCQQW